MKTATLPSLRVEPELRLAAEAVLQEGESLSGFIEQSLRANIHIRQLQQAFLARGLAARKEAFERDEYFDADDVLAGLDERLTRAEASADAAK